MKDIKNALSAIRKGWMVYHTQNYLMNIILMVDRKAPASRMA